jgi:hypothetical protein
MNTLLIDVQYLPPVTWFARVLQADEVVLERCENFVKATNRHRTEVAMEKGRHTLSIPLLGGRDSRRLYTDTIISYEAANWQKSHWHSIIASYGSAPFFEFYEHKLKPFYTTPYTSLYDYNLKLTELMFSFLKVNITPHFTKEYEKEPKGVNDFRSTRLTTFYDIPPYYQVFADKTGFQPDVSIIDLIFNLGPAAKDYLLKLEIVED